MEIRLGSENKAKVAAVTASVSRIFPDAASVNVVGCLVSSGVSDQPLSDSETMQGTFASKLLILALQTSLY